MGIVDFFRTISGRAVEQAPFTRTRAARHAGIDLIALRRRRAKNKVARRSRRTNQIRSAR